jgi:hypothetical protein
MWDVVGDVDEVREVRLLVVADRSDRDVIELWRFSR